MMNGMEEIPIKRVGAPVKSQAEGCESFYYERRIQFGNFGKSFAVRRWTGRVRHGGGSSLT